MNKIVRSCNNLLMDYHWHRIREQRSCAAQLIAAGAPCTDPRLVELSNQILSHGIKVSRLWRSSRTCTVYNNLLEDDCDTVTV